MAFVTVAEARAAASGRGLTASAAQAEMRKAAAAPMSTEYDIFLSHSSEDAAVIAGVKTLLEQDGMKVYVYWIEDGQAQRVTKATADNLRSRMQHCRALIYASSQSSPQSKWMPWELGYFDGRKPGRVAIFPLTSSAGSSFVGQEYLALYPKIERINWQGGLRSLGISTGETTAARLSTFLRDGVRL
jgi:TIR domain